MSSMSGALQSQLTTTLRYLGLIKTTGQPSDLLARLVNSEGPERAKVMREIVTTSYPFLFDSFDLKNATPRMLEEQFIDAGASGGTVDKCVLFFLAAAKEAEIEVSPHVKNPRGQRTQRNQRMRNVRIPTDLTPPSNESVTGMETGDLTWEQMLLTKFPSFDPVWPDEVKSKWFDGFHRLMRVGKSESKE